MARPDLSDALRGGLVGVALGEALGLPWAGVPPRRIGRAKLYDEVGPTGAVTTQVLAAATRPDGDGAGGLPAALVLGWREPDALARHTAALHLGFAPVMVADLAAWAIRGQPLYHLVADHADDWPPPFHGVAADDRAIVDALLAILHRHDDPLEGMRAAVRLGGGATATLGALVGGILGSRRPTALDRAEWRERVPLPDPASLDAAVAVLAARR
ncbi:MAG TPA: ADP-ribosylglycohydrolase family protein [Baekduia sp.]